MSEREREAGGKKTYEIIKLFKNVVNHYDCMIENRLLKALTVKCNYFDWDIHHKTFDWNAIHWTTSYLHTNIPLWHAEKFISLLIRQKSINIVILKKNCLTFDYVFRFRSNEKVILLNWHCLIKSSYSLLNLNVMYSIIILVFLENSSESRSLCNLITQALRKANCRQPWNRPFPKTRWMRHCEWLHWKLYITINIILWLMNSMEPCFKKINIQITTYTDSISLIYTWKHNDRPTHRSSSSFWVAGKLSNYDDKNDCKHKVCCEHTVNTKCLLHKPLTYLIYR